MIRPFSIYIISLLVFFTGTKCNAQGQTDNWYFGYKAAINFSGACNPTLSVITTSQMDTYGWCSTISDSLGNLLFYTNGSLVYDRSNKIMQNGSLLFGGASIIIPQPGNSAVYFIFTTNWEVNGKSEKGLYYSVVDMNGNGGLGAVVTKNVNLHLSVGAELTGVMHHNKKDFWVITREYDSYNYDAWLVTDTGVSNTPVVSKSPFYIGPSPLGGDGSGYMKVSPDGKKLAAAYYEQSFYAVMDFDNKTGAITNSFKIDARNSTMKIPVIGTDPYGVEFSPDSKLLYTSTIVFAYCLCANNQFFYINQYDLRNTSNPVLVDSGGIAPHQAGYGAMQLARNGKIYLSRFNKNKLCAIDSPNVKGTGCSFKADAVDLGPGVSTWGLPNFIQSYVGSSLVSFDFDYTEGCNRLVNFTLNGAGKYDSLRWNFDDVNSGANNNSTAVNPAHVFTNGGFHTVNLYVFKQYNCTSICDTITQLISIGQGWFNLGPDRFYCSSDNIILDATVTGTATYLWNTGATSSTIKVLQPGNYWCEVTKDGCTYRDDVLLTENPSPVVNLGNDVELCPTNTLLLDVTNTNAVYTWQDKSNNATYLVTKAGKYFVKVDKQGCIASDTINVVYNAKPVFDLAVDNNRICPGNIIVLDPKITGVNYLWQDASTNATFTVVKPGLYYLTASNNCGSASDSITIGNGVCNLYIPNSFTPNADGRNDIFKAGYGDNVTDFHLQVFNRYGQVIFATKDKNNGWDGTYKAVAQPSDTYVWMIQYKIASSNDLQKLQGTVLLIR